MNTSAAIARLVLPKWDLLFNFPITDPSHLYPHQLCKTFRRPMVRRAKNTGAWQLAFEVLACLSIMTNCGILYLSPQVRFVLREGDKKSSLCIFWLISFFCHRWNFNLCFFVHNFFSPTWHRDLTEIMSTELKLILFVMVEHFLLLVAWLIHKAIPDRPTSVRISLARADYESKQALKREVLNQLFCWCLKLVFYLHEQHHCGFIHLKIPSRKGVFRNALD